jgi:Protein of unknown function (DUF3383)
MRGICFSIVLIVGALSSASGVRANNPCQRLLLGGDNFIGSHRVLSFANAAEVENLLGDTEPSYALAVDFFSDTSKCTENPAVLEITRFGTGQNRPHLVSADLNNLPAQSCASARPGCGTNIVSLVLNGTKVTSANIDLRGSPSTSEVAGLIQTALQANRPKLARTTSSTITPESVGPFRAYGQDLFMMITSGGPIPLGSEVSDYPQPPTSPCCTLSAAAAGMHGCMLPPGDAPLMPTNDAWANIDTTQNVVGVAALYTYNTFWGVGISPCSAVESATAYYGLLNVHCPCRGRIQTGQDVVGRGVALYTTIWSNVSGGAPCDSNCGGPYGVGAYCLDDGCDGTSWTLGGPTTAVGQSIGPEPLDTVSAAVEVEYHTMTVGASTTYSYFDYSTHVFAMGLQSISYLKDETGTVAAHYMSRTEDKSSGNFGAWDDSPGSVVIARCRPGGCRSAYPDLSARLKASFDLLAANLPGSFQTEYAPCDPTSPSNYHAGPAMLPGLDARLKELSDKYPPGYPLYLAGCKYAGNYTPPASDFPGAH